MTAAQRFLRGRLAGDEGATLAEFALIMPFLAMITMGLLEYGFLFRQTTSLAGIVQGGARTAVNLGAVRNADKDAIKGIMTEANILRRSQVSRIVIWNADSQNTVPTACLTASVSGSCNSYSAAQIATAVNGTGDFTTACTGNTGAALDHFFCPTSRVASVPGPPTWVGIYVETTYSSFSKFFPGFPNKLKDSAVFREEVTL